MTNYTLELVKAVGNVSVSRNLFSSAGDNAISTLPMRSTDVVPLYNLLGEIIQSKNVSASQTMVKSVLSLTESHHVDFDYSSIKFRLKNGGKHHSMDDLMSGLCDLRTVDDQPFHNKLIRLGEIVCVVKKMCKTYADHKHLGVIVRFLLNPISSRKGGLGDAIDAANKIGINQSEEDCEILRGAIMFHKEFENCEVFKENLQDLTFTKKRRSVGGMHMVTYLDGKPICKKRVL
jgi:hypothetical protein